jgi:hypothetical protein
MALVFGRPCLSGFDGGFGRVERSEPDFSRRFLGRGLAIAADGDDFAKIVFGDQDHEAILALADPRGAAVELAGLSDLAAILRGRRGILAAHGSGVGSVETTAHQQHGQEQ